MADSYLNLPKSMSLQTGGRAWGATSTRSSSDSWASCSACSMRTMPTCSPLGPTRRTSGTRIRSLIRGSLMCCSFIDVGGASAHEKWLPHAGAREPRVRPTRRLVRHLPNGEATPPEREGPDLAPVRRSEDLAFDDRWERLHLRTRLVP